jgi:hypothetical protein
MAHEQHFPSNERFSHSERYTRPIKPSRKSLILYGLLFAVLLVFAQYALSYICGRLSSLYPWLIGTPLCYLLFSGFSALKTTGLQEKSQDIRWGCISGLLTSIFGMLLGSLIVISFVIITVKTFQASPQLPTGHSLPGPGLGIIILVFFIPVFLLVNFGSIFLGLLGGMLGGLLRSRLSTVKHNKDTSVPTYQ